MDTPSVDWAIEQLKTLPQDHQWRVLEFTRAVAQSAPPGVAGRQIAHLAGPRSAEDAGAMREAEGGEQADANE
ncbi:MAG: hypothetical protein MUC88_18920 [Planctomycetes bacterium]|nr:hypothetical protein [Planctomycetota bacterium]